MPTRLQRKIDFVDRKWLSSVKTQVLLNGEADKEIVLRRSPRQGDPLYPLLFILVVDGLNIMCRRLERANLIHGLSGSLSFTITSLQYADNTLIFGRGNVREAIYVK